MRVLNPPRRPVLSVKPKPTTQKRWSHQDELTALRGKAIIFTPIATLQPKEAILVEADQYTLKVEVSVDGEKSVLTLFKAALMGYSAA
jgi:hypothetical protein